MHKASSFPHTRRSTRLKLKGAAILAALGAVCILIKQWLNMLEYYEMAEDHGAYDVQSPRGSLGISNPAVFNGSTSAWAHVSVECAAAASLARTRPARHMSRMRDLLCGLAHSPSA